MVRKPWLFCLPALLTLGFLTGYPLFRTITDSLTNVRLGNMDHASWIGLENYRYLLKDPDWWRSVRNTLVFTVSSVTLETLAGLVVALILNSKMHGRGLVRTSMLVPWAIPAVVSARIWAWMFNDIYGVINTVLGRIGVTNGQTAWLADDRWAMVTLVTVDVWKTTPFMGLLLLAGLQSIPITVHEASQVDGANFRQELFHITLPLLQPALWVAVLFRFLDALRVFDLPFVLTSNSKATSVVSIYARQQMVDFQEVGYGSAASFFIFCVISLIAVTYLASARKQLGLDL